MGRPSSSFATWLRGAKVFDFCPDYMIPETEPPTDHGKGMSMNGWHYAVKPNVPYQKSFTVTLQGMCWYLTGGGMYDVSMDPRYNGRRLELFYEGHGLWKFFEFQHPHLGLLEVRFALPVKVPKALANSGGLIESFEIKLVEHSPPFRTVSI